MNNFGKFLTPAELVALGGKQVDSHPLEYWEELARKVPAKCISCETENEWKFGETEMCFSCTTGEADASGDCEIEELWR